MSVRAVLFDAAGTLIHLREPLGEIYARTAARFGVQLPPWRIEDAFRRVFQAAPAMVFPGRTRSEIAASEREWWRQLVRANFRAADGRVRFTDFDAFFSCLWDHFAKSTTWQAAPGTRGVLQQLRGGGQTTGIVSNFDQRLPGILRGLGLESLVDVVVLPADAGAAKPDPRIFQHALEILGVEALQTVYVGDDPVRDLQGARAAGLRAIDVTTLANLRALPARLTDEPAEPMP